MNAKILLIALSAAAFSSCSTAYKSGQTPDDVYYSPVRVVDERKNDQREEVRQQPQTTADDARIRMQIRDRRWRDLNYDYDYDYSYNNSPYYYSYKSYNNYGYYYNPYYCSRPLYYPQVTVTAPVNTTPRMVNLNTYKNYSTAIATDPKTGSGGTKWVQPTRQYNNSNNGGSRVGNVLREVFTPNSNSNSNSNNNSSSNNNTRTYTPAPSTPSSSSGSSGSSSGGSSGGSVARPSRGG